MFSIWRIMNRATEILSHILEPKFSFFHRNLLEEVERESKSRSVVSNSLQTHGLYSPWNSPDQNTGMGSLFLLQSIFPTQGSNPGLLHCRQILYQLSYKGSPRILEWVAYPFSSRSSRPRNQTRVSCIAGGFFTNWAIREAPSLPAMWETWVRSLGWEDPLDNR